MARDVSKLNIRFKNLCDSVINKGENEDKGLISNGSGKHRKCISKAVDDFATRANEGNVANNEIVGAAIQGCRFLKLVEEACKMDMIADCFRGRALSLEQCQALLYPSDSTISLALERFLFSKHPALLQTLRETFEALKQQREAHNSQNDARPTLFSGHYMCSGP